MHTGLVLAASSGGAQLGSLLILALPLLLLLFLMRSQRRRNREIASLQRSVAVGDEVVTTSGMFGTVRELTDDQAVLEVAPGVSVRFDRRAIGSRHHPAAPSPAAPQDTEPGNA
ncbi:MAG: preprotein translocase subunit YajC [Tetrasphaera sp.]|nr:preprotein translocase subunit YajC [Tetrasphaera sp.]